MNRWGYNHEVPWADRFVAYVDRGLEATFVQPIWISIVTLLPLMFAIYIEEDDRNLAGRLKRREPAAMAELYDRYGKLAYSLIYRVVRDVGVAEDLVQETFLRVWNRAQGFDAERGALGPWLLAVARNRAIDYVRSSCGKMARGSLELAYAEHPSVFVNFEADVLSQDRRAGCGAPSIVNQPIR